MKNCIYLNLTAELIKHRHTLVDISQYIGKSLPTLYAKLKGKTEFTLSEMESIQAFFYEKDGEPFTLDYLFAKFKN